MAFSYKQKLFAEFMLKRIGLEHADHIEQYLIKLENIYGSWYEYTDRDGYTTLNYSVSNCIQQLIDEIELKKNKNNIAIKEYNSSKLAATDLSSYVFCPVSFSINKSFIIEKPTGEELTSNGITLHEQLRLLKKNIPYNLKENEAHDSNVFQNEIIKRIRNSEVVFVGHSERKQYFSNDQENFIGEPDYIFKDELGKYFVVEEKYHSLKKKNHRHREISQGQYEKTVNRFFDNHEIQLISYIRNIKEYKIDYGYLIYWYYQTSKLVKENTTYSAFPQIHDVRIKKVELDQTNIDFYNKTIQGINALISASKQDISATNIVTNKCVGCVVNKYCIQKTGRLTTFNFPYKKEDIMLFYAKFPDELKKTQV